MSGVIGSGLATGLAARPVLVARACSKTSVCVGGVSGSELAARHQCVWGGLVAQSLQQDISVCVGG